MKFLGWGCVDSIIEFVNDDYRTNDNIYVVTYCTGLYISVCFVLRHITIHHIRYYYN